MHIIGRPQCQVLFPATTVTPIERKRRPHRPQGRTFQPTRRCVADVPARQLNDRRTFQEDGQNRLQCRQINARPVAPTRNPTTSFLTATTLIYAIGAGITAAAGTRLALQLIIVKGFKLYSFQEQDYE